MSKIPSQKTPFNISDIIAKREFNEQGRETFRAYGTDYSELGGEVFYLGSAPLERFIAFKAFFQSIKFNLQKDAQVDNIASRNFQIIKEKSGKLSIDVELVLPAHSTNEARNNLAKIEELQRLILPAKWSAGTYYLNEDGQETDGMDFNFKGVSTNTRLTTPLFHAYFKNVINSGSSLKPPKVINKYRDLLIHGFPCYIDNVIYEPDDSAGYFEFNNYLFPKLINLKLSLNYETETLFDETRDGMKNKTILPFQLDGHFSNFDSSLFPFGVSVTFNDPEAGQREEVYEYATGIREDTDFSMYEMNSFSSDNTYVFISMTLDPSESFPHRYVRFKPFIEGFSRSVKTKIELAETANSTIHSRVLQHGVTPDITEYTFKINMPASSLLEAKKNCGKIQYLMRMFFKKYSSGMEELNEFKPRERQDINFEDFKQKLMVYIPSMIEMPNSGKAATTPEAMFKNAVPLYLKDLSFDIDMDAGFFEQGNSVYPKVMSVDFSFIYNRADMIRNYNLGETGQEDYYFHKPRSKAKQPIIDSKNAHLFPFDRKTSKIGAPK